MQNNTNKQNLQYDDINEEILNMMTKNTNDASIYTRNGIKIPDIPQNGEPMICQYCGKIIYPDDFSKDALQRKLEFKWHLHPQCKQAMEDEADRFTPGLISERQKAMGEYGQRIKQKNTSPASRGITSKHNKRIAPVKEFGKKIPKRHV